MSKPGRALLDRLTADALGCARDTLGNARDTLDDPADATAAFGLERMPPEALALLLRMYPIAGTDELRDAIEASLGDALVRLAGVRDADETAAWIPVLCAAAAVSDDARLLAAIDRLTAACTSGWPSSGRVSATFRRVEAALEACASGGQPPALLASAIDEMERLVGHTYSPGSGVVHEIGRPPQPGTLADHAAASAALLQAHALTGRLPYAMLADELTQCARRRWRPDGGVAWSAPFAEVCEACRVMCRLALLYRDDEYRGAAVLGAVDYVPEAERALGALEPRPGALRDNALYGLAVFELLAIQSAI
jgi:hypothetical protein